MFKFKLSPLYVAGLAASLTACSGAEDIIEKLVSNVVEEKYIHGVAIDGYLSNAKVCIDVNKDLVCSPEDGAIAITDEQGRYKLALGENSLEGKQLLVQAIAGETIDMDRPSAPILVPFTYTASAKDGAIISPISSVINAIATQKKISLALAEQEVSNAIGIASEHFNQDFVANSDLKAEQVHALAQALTVLMQKLHTASVTNNDPSLAITLLSKLSLRDLKAITDKVLQDTAKEPSSSGTLAALIDEAVDNFIGDFIATAVVDGDITTTNTSLITPELQAKYDEFNLLVKDAEATLNSLPKLYEQYKEALASYGNNVNDYLRCQAVACGDLVSKAELVTSSLEAVKRHISEIQSASADVEKKIAKINQSYGQLISDLTNIGELDKVKVLLNIKQSILAKFIVDSDREEPKVPDADGDGVADAIDAFPNDKYETNDKNSNEIGDNAEAIADAFNDFTLELFKASGQQSLVVSPFSIAQALSMTLAGAKESTALELGSTLSLPTDANSSDADKIAFFSSDLPLGMIRSMNRYVEQKGEADNAVFNSANSFWLANTFDVKKEYTQRLTEFFKAEPNTRDFTDPSAVATDVNAWVARNTHNEVKTILQPKDISTDTRSILANAVYFKGGWVNSFDTNLTQDRPFITKTNGAINLALLPTMEQKLSTSFYQGKLGNIPVTAVDLDYGMEKTDTAPAHSRYSMSLLLPTLSDNASANYYQNAAEGDLSLSQLEGQLTWNKLKPFLSQLDSTPILRNTIVKLPKFRVETEIDGIEVLKSMGLKAPFDGNADFSGISSEPVYIDKIKHKAIVEVEEKGTTAAGATAVIVSGRSLSYSNEFNANRPFIYIIRDNKLNNILFIGKFSG